MIWETWRTAYQYGGVRVTTVAYMGSAKIPVQVDVGIGDAITPTARVSEYRDDFAARSVGAACR